MAPVLRGGVLLGLLLVLGASGCNDRRQTERQVCNHLVPAVCEYRIRCGSWAGTQADCELVEGNECCSGAFCNEVSSSTAADLRVCAASIRGSVCSASGPALSSACPWRITGGSIPSGFDAGF